MIKLLLIPICLTLVGCASSASKEAANYYTAARDIEARRAETRQATPMLSITGKNLKIEGDDIKIVVHVPESGSTQPLQPYQAPVHPGWAFASSFLNTAASIYSPIAAGKSSANLVNAVGSIANGGFSALASANSNIGGLGQSIRPTVTTTITNTNSGNTNSGTNAGNVNTGQGAGAVTTTTTTNTNSGNTTTSTNTNCASGNGGANTGTNATVPPGSGAVKCGP